MKVNLSIDNGSLRVAVDSEEGFDLDWLPLKTLADALRPLLFPEPKVVSVMNIDLSSASAAMAHGPDPELMQRLKDAVASAPIEQSPRKPFDDARKALENYSTKLRLTAEQIREIRQNERESIIKRLNRSLPHLVGPDYSKRIETIIREEQ